MKKYFQYLWVVLRHKWFVLRECRKRGLYWRGIVHDLSKFSLAEFPAYADHFHGRKIPMDKDTAFQEAWAHHLRHNPHHWECWLDGNRPMAMHFDDALEMFCDWVGAGMAYEGKRKVLAWWVQNSERINLHENTRRYIEELMAREKNVNAT